LLLISPEGSVFMLVKYAFAKMMTLASLSCSLMTLLEQAMAQTTQEVWVDLMI